MSLNIFVAIGNCVRDPEYRYFANGGGVCNFTIAVNNPKKNAQTGAWDTEAAFIDCTAWDRGENKMGQRISESFRKGQRIQVSGKIIQENWDDKATGQKRSKLKCLVGDFGFIDKKDDSQRQSSPPDNQGRGESNDWGGQNGASESDTEIPF